MKDYYQILGILSSADQKAIKTAYKALALKYHPDLNQGSSVAEQKFKEINEAYQVLSDSQTKSQYDLRYSYKNYQFSDPLSNPVRSPRKQTTVYNRYGNFNWKNKPRYHKWRYYKVDKQYYKHQLYTLGVFAAIALIILAVQAYNRYMNELEIQRIAEKNNILMMKAEMFFKNRTYDSTFTIVLNLINNNPFQPQFQSLREDYVNKVQAIASNDFNKGNFNEALLGYYAIKKYQEQQQLDNWHNIANTFKAMDDYINAAAALEYIQLRDTGNFKLTMEIADLYAEELNNKEKALEFYTYAKRIFKERQSSIYGNAFELVIDPSTLDQSYYDLFYKRALINIDLNNIAEAITDCNWGVFLKPKATDLYFQRGNCWLILNNLRRACNNWRQAIELGDRRSIDSIKRHCR